MDKDRRFRAITVVALIIAIISLTIGYAAYTSTLKINGAGHVSPSEWKVLFKYSDGKSAVGTTRVGKIDLTDVTVPTLTATIISGFDITLRSPGDSVTFDFKIANEGELDAKLSTFNIGSLTCRPAENSEATQVQAGVICADLSYTLTLDNNVPAVNDLLIRETSKVAKLKLSWISNSNAVVDGPVDVKVGETTLLYVQK